MTTEIATQQSESTKTTNDTTQAQQQQLVSPKNEPLKYPLEDSWSFWFYRNDKAKEWKDNLVFITNVDFVEDFWAVYNHLQPVSKLSVGCDYMFFKKGINPMWEDEQNRDGGRWLLQVDKKNRSSVLDAYWLNTLLALIGDQYLDDSECVNGAYINLRAKGDRLSLWTKHANDQKLQHRIG